MALHWATENSLVCEDCRPGLSDNIKSFAECGKYTLLLWPAGITFGSLGTDVRTLAQHEDGGPLR
jgi:hypothetical protein